MLTTPCDVFSTQVEAEMDTRAAETAHVFPALTAEARELSHGETWNIALFFGRLPPFLLPHNSIRDRMLKMLHGAVRFPLDLIQGSRSIKHNQ